MAIAYRTFCAVVEIYKRSTQSDENKLGGL